MTEREREREKKKEPFHSIVEISLSSGQKKTKRDFLKENVESLKIYINLLSTVQGNYML